MSGEDFCILCVSTPLLLVIQTGVLVACPSIMLSMALDDNCEDALDMKAMIIVPVWLGFIFAITFTAGAAGLLNGGGGSECMASFILFLGGFMVLYANGCAIEFNNLCLGNNLEYDEYEPYNGIPLSLILVPIVITSVYLIPAIPAVLLGMIGEFC